MPELTDAPVVPVGDAGFLVALNGDPETPQFQQIAASELAATAAKAETAVQPTQLGSAAYADTDSFVSPEQHAAAVADLQTQIDALVEMIRVGATPGADVLPATLPFTVSE
ncbi:hypothetical protein [Amaricoccus solimangrovi]|uniref:hypothetical protein n=1 Tax=Amaricoccus solimangrovi TaxID=2589815 RepID=UPI0015E48746|nr:hypothetical protein [Amaricoccus solimangrovi]